MVEDPDDRFEQISRVIEEARGLGHRIDLLEVSSRTLSEMAAWQEDEKSFNPQPLISTFQAFKFAAHAYLRQIVYRMPAVSLDAQLSVARMLTTISTVLNTPSQSQILFPLFIAGVDAIREEDRFVVKSIFEKLHTITGTGNIQTVFTLLLSIWKDNDKGNTWVDWRQIASDVSAVNLFFPKTGQADVPLACSRNTLYPSLNPRIEGTTCIGINMQHAYDSHSCRYPICSLCIDDLCEHVREKAPVNRLHERRPSSTLMVTLSVILTAK